MDYKEIIEIQKNVCKKYGSPWIESPENMKVGIAQNVRSGLLPINGLRHPVEGDTTGWYIWAGEEPSNDPNFFVPLHVTHLEDWCHVVLKYLGLAPGWRFLIANDYEDVWQDQSLLNI